MILAIDIGNTAIKFAFVKGKRVLDESAIFGLDAKKTIRQKIQRAIQTAKRKHPKTQDVVICSVVPGHLKIVEGQVKKVFKKKALVIGRHLKVPLKNRYKNPGQVGADRLVGAFAAKNLFRAPVIIIDFGTAVTFDIVNTRGEYEGGIIVPGIRLSAESLFKKTALLPNISRFQPPRSVVGKDTRASILSGLFYGYGALCNGLIDQITATMSPKPGVIITGGHTRSMRKFLLKRRPKVEKQLVFKGIGLIYTLQK